MVITSLFFFVIESDGKTLPGSRKLIFTEECRNEDRLDSKIKAIVEYYQILKYKD